MDEIVRDAPRWLLRPIPAFCEVDLQLENEVRLRCEKLPASIEALHKLLNENYHRSGYDSAVNLANAHVWSAFGKLLEHRELAVAISDYCRDHFNQPAMSRVIRRMIVHPDFSQYGKRLRKETDHLEVSLPLRRWGYASSVSWNATRGGRRYAGSSRRRENQGVPDLATVRDLRELLQIRSPKQLGFLLSAVVGDGGPYTEFAIAKRSGESRAIFAPCETLLWVQRRLHRKILAQVPPNDAAHGFIQGRSTVSNAKPHVGASLVLKFDLRDFFPTISQHRITGLFASMGYHVGRGRYNTDDRSRDVAPVLARLCVATRKRSYPGVLPQGAPTSPAISNLICRRLDQRMTGLAAKFGGVYTRYADDLTFSFRDEILVGKFRWWVDQICFQEGFTVRQDKFRAIRSSQSQRVTGIVVNDRLNIARRDRRRFRAILHQCRLNGIREQEKKHPGLAGYMRGFAAYVNMVDPNDDGALMREVARVLGDDT